MPANSLCMVACLQPGCRGQIDDGYCDHCGLAPIPIAIPPRAHESQSTILPTLVSQDQSKEHIPPDQPPYTLPTFVQRTPVKDRFCLWAPLLPQDPLAALVSEEVPPQRRICSNCEGLLQEKKGYCRNCGQEYSFLPGLRAGQVLAERYEVKGTLAFGGLGWIYLAHDLILGRWVTLKGLLNPRDRRLSELATQEREYLALVKHPNIVAIYDFLSYEQHGFIVMEFVNGLSLARIRKATEGPIPTRDALAYIHEILPALEYLHEQGLVYCDFKPNNVMIEGRSIKLIDLGAVRRNDEVGGDIYGSRGYSAPEAAEHPSSFSDLYSVGRTLALLVANFDYQQRFEYELPSPVDCEVFSNNPALFALLKKATARDPNHRFASASEFREQIAGVLSLEFPGSLPEPPQSRLFFLDDSLCIANPTEDFSLPQLLSETSSSVLHIKHIESLIALSNWGEATQMIAKLDQEDWRNWWLQASLLFHQKKYTDSIPLFQRVSEEFPGEISPLFALARAHESRGHKPEAASLYQRIYQANPNLSLAAFALARCWLTLEDRRKAISALRSIPNSSRFYLQSSLLCVTQLLQNPTIDDVFESAEILGCLPTKSDPLNLTILRADTLAAAARSAAGGEVRGGTVLEILFEERALRQAAERAYRDSASICRDPRLRSHLIDAACTIRPWSLF